MWFVGSLAEKQKKMQEEADGKVKLIRQSLSKDYDEKAKKQEERQGGPNPRRRQSRGPGEGPG